MTDIKSEEPLDEQRSAEMIAEALGHPFVVDENRRLKRELERLHYEINYWKDLYARALEKIPSGQD